MTQLIKAPTRITSRSKTLINHIYTTDTDKVIASGVAQCSISDHSLIFLIHRSRKQRSPLKTIHYRNFKNYTYSSEQFQSDLHTTSWEEVDTSLTVNEAWHVFLATLSHVIDRHTRLATKKVRASSLRTMMRR